MKLAVACLLVVCHNTAAFVARCCPNSVQHRSQSLAPHRSVSPTHDSRTYETAWASSCVSAWEGVQCRAGRLRAHASRASALPAVTRGDGGNRSSKCPILICPAQLGVPGDYENMIAELNQRGFPAYCADLTRLGWIIGLLPSALSLEYITGNLDPAKTLRFYYEAIDKALEEVKANHPGEGVHLIGHSIGGWITRAWLAEECSDADRGNTLSLTMLGTPNNNPPKENPVGGDWTALDQTRGLLRNINERFPGAYVDSVQYTSVCGTALQGKIPGSFEEMLASFSYSPLSGDINDSGDGVVPFSISALEGSNIIELPTSKHSGFVPFPGKAIDLGEDFLWYGSPSVMDQWIETLDKVDRQAMESRKPAGGVKAEGVAGWPW